MKIKSKKIVVTGAGSGLGRELVFGLLARGAKVAAVDISEKSLSETKALAKADSSRLQTYVADITKKEVVMALPQRLKDDFGEIDGLINNAGIIQPFVKVNDLDYKDIERVMNVNFYGALYMTKSFLPYLLKRPVAHLVNVSSMGGFLPVPGQSIYGASKAALKLMTEGLYSELLDTNVRVSIVLPGAMETKITKNSGVEVESANGEADKFEALPAQEAAEIVTRGVEKDAFRILVGSDAKFMDFLYRWNPKFATRFIYKKMKSLLGDSKEQ